MRRSPKYALLALGPQSSATSSLDKSCLPMLNLLV
eukprot:CAMPEP_0204207698 /NCGR_PEP_ID=MMETSP0361-20130328/71940_1 /ASSEMBLY_ACC=CAM_ASM_000343 /TAXON_ID=268821 /ORGANISM="Scrippsiella Hangoei, Strain SHTV-5" /LENGTH=34 /DNA_ID= /DNA_START= /DNA_END= /DNA_ORIENTATION=